MLAGSLLAVGMGAAQAGFQNGGFEAGDLTDS